MSFSILPKTRRYEEIAPIPFCQFYHYIEFR